MTSVSVSVCCDDLHHRKLTTQQLAKEQGVQAAQDARQRLLLQQRDVAARGCARSRQQRALYALQPIQTCQGLPCTSSQGRGECTFLCQRDCEHQHDCWQMGGASAWVPCEGVDQGS